MLATWSQNPRVDWLIAGVVASVWGVVEWLAFDLPIGSASPEARRTAYEMFAGLGFATIALFVLPVTLMLSLAPTDRLRRILDNESGELRESVVHAGAASLILILVAIAAVITDLNESTVAVGTSGNGIVQAVALGALLATALAAARVLRTVAALLKLREADARPTAADDVKPSGLFLADRDQRTG